MSTNPERVAVNILLSREARDGLNEFARSQGVSLTAFLEMWGQYVSREDFDLDEFPGLKRWLEEARRLDAERRRRE